MLTLDYLLLCGIDIAYFAKIRTDFQELSLP